MIKYQESEEMYLETILILKQNGKPSRSVDVANELGYSRASVSRGVGLLVKKGFLIVEPNGTINFTELGQKRAENIYERHCIITKLLIMSGADSELAEENACRIEHVISPELFEVLKNYVKNK